MDGDRRADGPLELRDALQQAYSEAYPELDAGDARHRARNLAQVITGVVAISERLGEPGGITQAELAGALIYWCVSNSYLEDLAAGGRDPALGGLDVPGVTVPELERIRSDLAAAAADILLAIDVLRRDPGMLAAFVKGTLALREGGREAGGAASSD